MLRSQASSGAVAAVTSRHSLLPFLYQTRTIVGSAHTRDAQPLHIYSASRQYSTHNENRNGNGTGKLSPHSWRLQQLENTVDDEVSREPPTYRKHHSMSRGDPDLIQNPLLNAEGQPIIRTYIDGDREKYDDTAFRERAALTRNFDKSTERRKIKERNNFWRDIRTQKVDYPFKESAEDEIEDIDRFRKTSGTTAQSWFGAKGAQVEDGFEDVGESVELERDFSERGPMKESTITVAERKAFQGIFKDIMARSKYSGERVPTQPAKSKRPGLSLVADSNAKGDAIRAAVESYPAPLRAAAARALGLASEKATMKAFEAQAATQETQDMVDELEHLRQPERERVEALMREAKTDFELWNVMEKEVFSIVDKLGIDEAGDEKPVSRIKRRGRPPKNPPKIADVTPSTSTASPDGVPPLALLGPLYPSHLLLGLRLLDRSFDKPSALVLNVLPRIKALGLISHVLGASLALYNELLRIHWTRYDDFPGVLKLLEEMEAAGLDFNDDTLDVVMEIRSMQRKVKLGEKGIALQALWSLPEYAPQKFSDWQTKIQKAMEEKGRELAKESRIEATWEKA